MRCRRGRLGLIDGPRSERHHQPGYEISKKCRNNRHRHQYQQHPDNSYHGRIDFEIFSDSAANAPDFAVDGRPHQPSGHARWFGVPRLLPCAAEVAEIRVLRDISLAVSAMHESDLLASHIGPHSQVRLSPIKSFTGPQYAARSRAARAMSPVWGRIASSSVG